MKPGQVYRFLVFLQLPEQAERHLAAQAAVCTRGSLMCWPEMGDRYLQPWATLKDTPQTPELRSVPSKRRAWRCTRLWHRRGLKISSSLETCPSSLLMASPNYNVLIRRFCLCRGLSRNCEEPAPSCGQGLGRVTGRRVWRPQGSIAKALHSVLRNIFPSCTS